MAPVLLGLTLLLREVIWPAKTKEEEPVDVLKSIGLQRAWMHFVAPHIAIIVAHEFGHILQYKSGMAPDGPWQMEPHADFLAGWLLARNFPKKGYTSPIARLHPELETWMPA